MPSTVLGKFRLVALIEGGSYLVLLLITWPIWLWGKVHWPNQVVGMTHGLLFILYCFLLWRVARSRGWSKKRVALAFAASIIPTATFFFDATVRRELAAEAATVGN